MYLLYTGNRDEHVTAKQPSSLQNHSKPHIHTIEKIKNTFNLTYLCWPKDESTRQGGGLSRSWSEKKALGSHSHLRNLLHSIHDPHTKEKIRIFNVSTIEIDSITHMFPLPIIYPTLSPVMAISALSNQSHSKWNGQRSKYDRNDTEAYGQKITRRYFKKKCTFRPGFST